MAHLIHMLGDERDVFHSEILSELQIVCVKPHQRVDHRKEGAELRRTELKQNTSKPSLMSKAIFKKDFLHASYKNTCNKHTNS